MATPAFAPILPRSSPFNRKIDMIPCGSCGLLNTNVLGLFKNNHSEGKAMKSCYNNDKK